MTTLVVKGGLPLSGRLRVGGNKNAALPVIAACLLTDEECVLENVPRIRDVEVMGELLRQLGATVLWEGDSTLRIRAANITSTEPRADLVAKLRGSVLLLGPLLARKGEAILGAPGGDFPSRRNLNQHHAAVKALGARPREAGGFESPEGLKAASFYMLEASVTATETALLAAALARGTTEIRHAACEPHVSELARFLSKMGADVSGIGSPTLRITGATRLTSSNSPLLPPAMMPTTPVGSYTLKLKCEVFTGFTLLKSTRTVGVAPLRSALAPSMSTLAKRSDVFCAADSSYASEPTSIAAAISSSP